MQLSQLPDEIINHILSFRPKHPICKIMEPIIGKWKFYDRIMIGKYQRFVLRKKHQSFNDWFFDFKFLIF